MTNTRQRCLEVACCCFFFVIIHCTISSKFNRFNAKANLQNAILPPLYLKIRKCRQYFLTLLHALSLCSNEFLLIIVFSILRLSNLIVFGGKIDKISILNLGVTIFFFEKCLWREYLNCFNRDSYFLVKRIG